MKLLFICGRWDEGEGHSSTIGSLVSTGLQEIIDDVDVHNGGNIHAIPYLRDLTTQYDSVVWMAQIYNDVEEKYVDDIKKLNKTCTLVTSKRNDGNYSFADVTNHALKKRSNLVIEN